MYSRRFWTVAGCLSCAVPLALAVVAQDCYEDSGAGACCEAPVDASCNPPCWGSTTGACTVWTVIPAEEGKDYFNGWIQCDCDLAHYQCGSSPNQCEYTHTSYNVCWSYYAYGDPCPGED